MTAKDKLRRRLGQYWRLELLNVLLVPAIMVQWNLSYGHRLGWGAFAAMVPMCGLLYIGGIYWRAKWQSLDAGPEPLRRTMPRIAKAKRPLLVLSVFAVGVAILLWVRPEFSASRGDRWTATVAAALAVLEYINYYHRQLQHFDHLADLKRLFTGRGFRPSQMSRDLANWKARRL